MRIVRDCSLCIFVDSRRKEVISDRILIQSNNLVIPIINNGCFGMQPKHCYLNYFEGGLLCAGN